MLFAVHNIDAPDTAKLRIKLFEAHKKFMIGLGPKAKFGGPLLADDGETKIGGMYVMEAETPEEARAIAAKDPYTAGGLYESVSVIAWRWQTGNPANNKPDKTSSARTRIYTDNVAEPPEETWSNCLVSDDLIFISGFTARANDGVTIEGNDAYAQTKIVLGKMKDYVEQAGGVMDDMLKLTIFVTDIKTNKDVWRARAEFFNGNFPACSLVEVSALATPEILVEIEGMGRLGCSRG